MFIVISGHGIVGRIEVGAEVSLSGVAWSAYLESEEDVVVINVTGIKLYRIPRLRCAVAELEEVLRRPAISLALGRPRISTSRTRP